MTQLVVWMVIYAIAAMVIYAIWLASRIRKLERDGQERRLGEDESASTALLCRLDALESRVQQLEGLSLLPEHDVDAAHLPTPEVDTAPHGVGRPSGDVAPAPPAAAAPAPPAPASPAPASPAPASPASLKTPGYEPADPLPPPVEAPMSAAFPDPAGQVAAKRSSVDLEGLIGGNWMARIGVLALVISLALAVGYSYAFLTPAGRIGIAYAAALSILGTGLYLERRRGFGRYGRVIVGGGWAAIYFTTYALHGVEASRVVDSPITASALLMLAAAAIIAHSLRYGSELATAMAFAVGFATLAISPMGLFALLATVLLAAVLLAVSYRFGWTRLALLGVLVTYGVYVFRGGTPPDTGFRLGDFLLGQAAPLVYWTMFEAFALVGRPRGRLSDGTSAADRNAHVDLATALNTTAFIGVSMLQWLETDASMFDYFLPMAAAMFLISAAVRARMPQPGSVPSPATQSVRMLRGYEMALAIATVFVVLAVLRRFTGMAEIVGLLLAGQLLLVGAARVREKVPRVLGDLVFAVAVMDLLARLPAPTLTAWRQLGGPGELGWSAAAGLTAAVLLANRLWSRRRPEDVPTIPAWLYSAAAVLLVAIVLVRELPDALDEVGWLALALLLLEAGTRLRLLELRIEAHVLAFAAWSTLIVMRVLPGSDPQGFWLAVGASTLLSLVGGVRLHRLELAHDEGERQMLILWPAATILLFLAFTHELLPTALVAPAWAVMGLLILELGYSADRAALRAAGVIVVLLALGRLYAVNLWLSGTTVGVPTSLLTVVPVLAGTYFLAARVSALGRTVRLASWENNLWLIWLWLAAPAVLLHLYRELGAVSPVLVPMVWAVFAGALLLAGYRFAVADLRWHSYLVTVGVVVVFVDALPVTTSVGLRVLATAVIAMVLYACRLGAPGEALGRKGTADGPEAPLSAMQGLAATAVVTLLLVAEVDGSLLTVALALQGAATLVGGLALGDRLLRLSGLALLGAAICKAFAYDLARLAALYRILSFLVLGLVLLAVSFLYTRRRERARRLL